MSKPVQIANERGLPLGTPSLPKNVRRSSPDPAPITDDSDGHLITFAPTGAGKGVSCIIPALLNWDGPAIVIDPKGENYAVTTRRRLQLGQRVALLDPFRVTGSNILDTLNPLDLISTGDSAVDDAAVLAKLITRGGHFPSDPFWDERAESLITGLILYVLKSSPGPLRTLAEVRHLLEASAHEQTMLAVELQHRGASTETKAAANILTLPSNRTRSSIITTASSHMSFMRSGPVQQVTSESSIMLDEIIGGHPVTVYLVLPPDKLLSHGKLLRLWLGVLMAALSRRRHRPERPTLLLIDEAAQLGPMDELRTAVTLMRGYGVKCWSFWQDLSQLQRTYPFDWPSIVNNCAVQQYFGLSMPQVAGEVETYLNGSSPRPLSQLADSAALLLRRGHRPQVVRRPDYLHDRSFDGQFAPNPLYKPLLEKPEETKRSPRSKPAPKNVLTFPNRPVR